MGIGLHLQAPDGSHVVVEVTQLNVGCNPGDTINNSDAFNKFCRFTTFLELNDGARGFDTTGYRLSMKMQCAHPYS
jgi:hypothetical protein